MQAMTQKATAANPNGLLLDAEALTEFAMRSGFKKTHMTFPKTCFLAVLAGVYVSFGGQTLLAALSDVTANGPVKLLGGTFFATGLMVIILCGAELFTGNVLIFIAVLARRVYVWEFLYDLVVVYFSNFLGVIVFAVIFWGSGVNGFDGELTGSGVVVCRLVAAKSQLPEYQALLRGIGANMCVCFAVLMAYASKTASGKILASIFPIAAFAAIGFEHSVANMFFFSMGTLLNCEGMLQRKAWAELFLCTAGNLLGAMFLAAAYWYINIHGTKLELQHVPHRRESDTCLLPHSTINPGSFCAPAGSSFRLLAPSTPPIEGVVNAEPFGGGDDELRHRHQIQTVSVPVAVELQPKRKMTPAVVADAANDFDGERFEVSVSA